MYRLPKRQDSSWTELAAGAHAGTSFVISVHLITPYSLLSVAEIPTALGVRGYMLQEYRNECRADVRR